MSDAVLPQPTQSKERSRLRIVIAKDRKAQFGLVVLALFVLAAIFAPILAPYDPNEMTLDMMHKPSLAHLLGTDDLGRDLLSRIIWGTQISLFVGVATVAIALLIRMIHPMNVTTPGRVGAGAVSVVIENSSVS